MSSEQTGDTRGNPTIRLRITVLATGGKTKTKYWIALHVRLTKFGSLTLEIRVDFPSFKEASFRKEEGKFRQEEVTQCKNRNKKD